MRAAATMNGTWRNKLGLEHRQGIINEKLLHLHVRLLNGRFQQTATARNIDNGVKVIIGIGCETAFNVGGHTAAEINVFC